MPGIRKLIGRTGLLAATATSVLAAANASGGLYGAVGSRQPLEPNWVAFNQADVLAQFQVPAFSLPTLTYGLTQVDPNPDPQRLVEHPSVIYYAILDDEMLMVEPVTGVDELNLLNFSTDPSSVDRMIDDGTGSMTSVSDELIGQPFLPVDRNSDGIVDMIDLDANDPAAGMVPACYTLGPGGVPNSDAVLGPGNGIVTACDDPDMTDGIAERWPLSGFGTEPVLDLIPIPDPNDDDARFDPNDEEESVIADVYAYYGLGNLRWSNDRPAFMHPDGEAIWRFAQANYGRASGQELIEFFESLPFDPLITGTGDDATETRLLFIDSFREMEKVTNLAFAERDPEPSAFSTEGPFSPPASANGLPILDAGGAQVLSGDIERDPEDDFAYILFTGPAGDGDVLPEGIAGISLTLSSSDRGPLGGTHDDVDYAIDDLDGDGFPDLLDNPFPFNAFAGTPADGVPDRVWLSTLSPAVGFDPLSGTITPATDPGVPGTPGLQEQDLYDTLNVPGTPLADTSGFGTGFVRVARADLPQIDFNNDGTGDFLLSVQGVVPLFDAAGDPAGFAQIGDGTIDPNFFMPNAFTLGIPDGAGGSIPGDVFPEDIDGDGIMDVGFIAAPSAGLLDPATGLSANFSAFGLAERHAPGHVALLDVGLNVGTIIHETMHQLGYAHEMIRSDRGPFVEIQFQNIDPELRSQFQIAAPPPPVGLGPVPLGVDPAGIAADADNDDNVDPGYTPDYDFESIMHYGRCGATPEGFCTDEQATILVLPPFTAGFQDIIGSGAISAGDSASLQAVYGEPQVPEDDPCAADLDGDNRITPVDLSIYIDLYLGCPGGPITPSTPNQCSFQVDQLLGNFDGIIDTLDLINFFSLYQGSRGCSPVVTVPVPFGQNPVAGNRFGSTR